ncbi:hypothetical protein [Segetibacter aerophilus]|uniref:hypothetical protein n=1 Tax=Segetibacter aerophilus TaxID=670293 RepID=UPI0014791EAA|nr:hypothetical protein [Segetibacter aerophilus]
MVLDPALVILLPIVASHACTFKYPAACGTIAKSQNSNAPVLSISGIAYVFIY